MRRSYAGPADATLLKAPSTAMESRTDWRCIGRRPTIRLHRLAGDEYGKVG